MGRGMDPNKSSSKDKKEIFKEYCFCLVEERRQQSGDDTRSETRGKFLMRMDEGENNSQRGQHVDGRDSAADLANSLSIQVQQ